jgi:hypothetical protein
MQTSWQAEMPIRKQQLVRNCKARTQYSAEEIMPCPQVFPEEYVI